MVFENITCYDIMNIRNITSLFVVGITIGIGIGLLMYYGRPKKLSFSLSDHDSSPCSSHCFKNNNDEISNVWDCCDCKATVTGHYEPNFHQCMCSVGMADYCFKPVTNFLLSQ